VKGKVAIVTGAASGIGFAIAKSFGVAGARVVLADVSPDAGEAAVGKLREMGAAVKFIPTDISKSEDVRRLMEFAFENFGRIDILINNAGLQHIAPVVDFPEDRWDYLLRVLLTGTFLCCKYAVPHMIRQKWGRVINIASLHGKVASPFKSAYVSAKHGVLGFTKVLALEVAEHNITSNAICPAYVRTPLVEMQIDEQARRHGISPEEVVRKIMLEPAAIRRLLEPEEVAAMALYLCSDQAAGITGAALDIDLGWTAR
jgi:3-hydroxybutyrate dehydrogenase